MSRQARTPSVRRNSKTGIYYIHWSRHGRSFRRSTGTTDQKIAEKIVAKFILDGLHEKDEGQILTVRALMDAYERGHVRRKVSSRTTYDYIERNLLAFFGDKQVADIDAAMVHAYEDKRKRGLIGKPSMDSTIRRELAVLTAGVNYGIKLKLLPLHEKPYIPLPRDSVPRDRWLTKEEAAKLLTECPVNDPETGRMTRAFRLTKIILNTAARRGSVEELTWQQVDFDQRVIHFNPPGRRQTKKRRVSVPINDDLLFVLERAWDERVSDFVLDTKNSTYHEFRSAVDRAGLTGVTPHTLRHTFGTWAAQRGVPLWKIAGVMGDSIDTTSKHYLHHCPDELRDAV